MLRVKLPLHFVGEKWPRNQRTTTISSFGREREETVLELNSGWSCSNVKAFPSLMLVTLLEAKIDPTVT